MEFNIGDAVEVLNMVGGKSMEGIILQRKDFTIEVSVKTKFGKQVMVFTLGGAGLGRWRNMMICGIKSKKS